MKNPLLTQDGIDRHIRKGYGQGKGPNYKPWLEIRHIPSLGKSSRPYGKKTGRIHHLLSQLELHYFYMLEWSDEVLDIQEQYPLLPRQETELIAETLGVNHPKHPRGQAPQVMTTDFLITTRSGILARSIKPSKDLESIRTLEKFEIERIFWQHKGIVWKWVTENEIDVILAKNVEWVQAKHEPDSLNPLGQTDIFSIQSALGPILQGKNEANLGRVCRELDQELGYATGSSLAVFRHLVSNKVWSANMHKRLDPAQPTQIEYETITQPNLQVA